MGEAKKGLPRKPPPSPATPSVAMHLALAVANTKTSDRDSAAEFARVVGDTLVQQLAAEAIAEDDQTETVAGKVLLETPRKADECDGEPATGKFSPEAPLSPLSLGSD